MTNDPQTIVEKIEKTLNLTIQPSFHSLITFILFSPVTPEEIHLLNGDIKMKKAVREKDIDNKLLKLSNTVISFFYAPFLTPVSNKENFHHTLILVFKERLQFAYKLLFDFYSFLNQKNF